MIKDKKEKDTPLAWDAFYKLCIKYPGISFIGNTKININLLKGKVEKDWFILNILDDSKALFYGNQKYIITRSVFERNNK